ncbi:MAG: hypothetical protein M3281_02150 [Chloroflexota bacterium]|nr:hypothetical protein [Chloroflexota bacterium]
MRQLSASILITVIASLMLLPPASAALTWCKRDPIVRLNGTEVQILVGVPRQYESLVNGPVDVEVRTPRSVRREVVLKDSGFNGYGETVTFRNAGTADRESGSFETRVRVQLPIDSSRLAEGEEVPVLVEVLPENGVKVTAVGTARETELQLVVTSSG